TPDRMISALGGASQCRCGPTPDDAPGRLADAVSVNAWHLPDLPLRAEEGPPDAAPSLRTRSERLTCPPEECESGRIGRSRKPLCLMGTVGSNPTSSARAEQAHRTQAGAAGIIGRASALPAAPG